MAAASLSTTSSCGRPWRCDGTALPPQVLLMAKLLWLLLMRHHFPASLEAPFLPFWTGLEVLRQEPEIARWSLRGLFIGAGLLLWLNVWVRLACGVAGGVVIFAMVGSMPLFRNHLWICGCLLWLSMATRNAARPTLLQWQFGVLYAGSALNKLMDPDWQDGDFMHHWLTDVMRNPLYSTMADWLPGRLVAAALCWTVMLTEIVLGVLLVVPRWQLFGVWLTFTFHVGMWLFLFGYRFGHFVEDILIGLMAFLHWPAGRIRFMVAPQWRGRLRRLQQGLDWNGVWDVLVAPSKATLRAYTDDRQVHGVAALAWMFRYSPGFYCALLWLDFLTQRFLPHSLSFSLTVALALGFGSLFLFADLRERSNHSRDPTD